jgi:hypothetical protein
VLGIGLACATLRLVTACLPDLGPRAQAQALPDASPLVPLKRRCGDGVIQLDQDYAEECDVGDAGPDAAFGCRPDTCTLACEGVVDARTKHCYFTLPGPMPYEAARQACIDRGAHVLTVGSAQELALLQQHGPFRESNIWLGLKQATSLEVPGYLAARGDEPGWPLVPLSSRCEGCFAATADASVAFAPFEVDAGPSLCVVTRLGEGTEYRSASCNAREIVALCEREPPGQSAEPCFGGVCLRVPETRAAKRYLLVREALPGTQARQSCLGLGGRLAVLSSPREREQVARALSDALLTRDRPKVAVWIGLGKIGEEWRWDNDAAVTPEASPWGNDAPETNDAGAPNTFGYMVLADTRVYDAQLAHADDGNTPRPYLCELPL